MKPHAILLRAPGEIDPASRSRPVGVAGAPAILQRTDDDFVDAVLEDLRSSAGRAGLAASLATTRADGVLKLFQPVQRQFHVALLEAVCFAPGAPRVDPARIESAGMVLRRIHGTAREGWMRAAGRLRGWVAVDAATELDARHDPLPANRLARKAVGPPALARELATFAAQVPDALLAEHVIPLFLAPPDVCADAGKTLYYGIVPTTSSDVSGAPGEMPEGFEASSAAFRDHLVAPLGGASMSLPGAGSPVMQAWRDQADIPPGTDGHDPLVSKFVQMLRQLAIEFDAFGENVVSQAVFAELETIALPLVLQPGETIPGTVTAGTFLRACVPPLLERRRLDEQEIAAYQDAGIPMLLASDPTQTPESWPAPEMPASWPARDAARLIAALSAALGERFKTVKGRAGRFDVAGARYQIRAFLRIKPECGCPTRTVWSEYSEPFTIAPWYEGSGAPPVQVPLPDATDRNLLKSLKPNVAFVVPPALNNLLAGSADDLAKGKGEASTTPDLQWICAFSIPLITICAFIVLNIFLSLFDLIFRWMLFIKICIPFPKISSSSSSSGG